VNCPLHEGTRGLVNADLLKSFKKVRDCPSVMLYYVRKCPQGAYLVNTARGAICDKDAVAAALKSGQLSGLFYFYYLRYYR